MKSQNKGISTIIYTVPVGLLFRGCKRESTNIQKFLSVQLLSAHEGEQLRGVGILTVLKLLGHLVHIWLECVDLPHLVLPVRLLCLFLSRLQSGEATQSFTEGAVSVYTFLEHCPCPIWPSAAFSLSCPPSSCHPTPQNQNLTIAPTLP